MYGTTVGQRDYGAEDAEERAVLAKRNKSMQLNPEWYEDSDQMMEDIQGRKTADAAARKAAIQERAQKKSAPSGQGGFATGHPMQAQYNAFIQGFGPQAQANALQGAIGQTMSAWQNEHDSRVAQNREMRRMEHEKEMKRMELDALLSRLAQAQQPTGPQPRVSGEGFAIY